MAQAKAAAALEPFLALTKSATSPRAAADLITQATSAPHTFLFAELLQAPQIQALETSPDYAGHLQLLKIFCYRVFGTYQDGATTLPALNDAQTRKLRQLSLLTLATEQCMAALSYKALAKSLNLASHRELEDLVISAVYAGLLDAQLDPKNQAVLINSVAALRDVEPASIPGLLASLQAWAGRCDATLASLEAQIATVKATAQQRAADADAYQSRRDKLMEEEAKGGATTDTASNAAAKSLTGGTRVGTGAPSRSLKMPQRYGKRGSGHMDAPIEGEGASEVMDVDEDDEEGKQRASRRRLQG